MAWGGIKYLEGFEFGLVHKLCRSRNRLLRHYPGAVREIRFFVTHETTFRLPLFLLYLGCLIYWIVGGCFTKGPRWLSRRTIAREEPVIDLTKSDGGFEYSDAYLPDNDARFVFGFVRGALDWGAAAANYVEAAGSRREGDLWLTNARDTLTGEAFVVRSRVVVNACGPFVDEQNARSGLQTRYRHVFSKGIHLVVRRLASHERVLSFFADDGRLFFAIPMGQRTCIGTTDTPVVRPRTEVTDADRRFVLANINKRLRLPSPLTEADIIAERCGVRPLAVLGASIDRDWLRLSRQHHIETSVDDAHISIFGGKITDCLNIGDEVARRVAELGIVLERPTARFFGEPDGEIRDEFLRRAAALGIDRGDVPTAERTSQRLFRRYGRDALDLCAAIEADPAKAEVLIAGEEFLRCEIDLMARREMICTLADFLRRRSKLALVFGHDELARTPGVGEACRILFGAEADAKRTAYFEETQPSAAVESFAL